MMRQRMIGLVLGLLLGSLLVATPAAQNFVWGSINGIPIGPGLVLTGPLQLPDGSYGAPAQAFASEPTLGFWREGAASLGLTARLFEVISTSTDDPRGFISAQYSTGTDGARLGFRKARGTFAAPTTVVTGDMLGRINAWGYDGTNFLNTAAIQMSATGTIAATRVPTTIRFLTGTDATPSVLTTALTLNEKQQTLLPDGTATLPSLAFANYLGTGVYTSGGELNFSAGGVKKWNIGGFTTAFTPGPLTAALTNSAFTLTQNLNTTGVVDGTLRVAITNTNVGPGSFIAAFYGGAAGTTRLFSVDMTGETTSAGALVSGGSVNAAAASSFIWLTRSRLRSSTDGVIDGGNNANTGFTALNLGPTTGNSGSGSTVVGHVVTTINMATATGTGTGTITSPTTALPAGTLIDGVTCRVSPELAGAGLTTFSIGDGSDVDRWGAAIAIALNTTTNISSYTVTAPAYQVAAGSIVLTAAAGVFSTGILTCTTHYSRHIPIGS